MLFWCLDLPVSSPTLAVPVEWFSLSLRENELGLEPLLVTWYHDLSPFLSHDKARDRTADIPSHDSERVERYQLPGQPRSEGFSLKALAGDEVGSLGRLFNLPMFSWYSCLHLFEQEAIANVLRLYCMKCDARQVCRRINTTSDRWHQWRSCLRLGVFFHWIVFIFAWRDVWITSFRFTFWTSAGKQVIFSTYKK